MPRKPSFSAKLLWEYLQNLPPALGFFLGFSFFERGEPAAWLVAALGGLLGALVIRYTEGFIEAGQREPWSNTAVNAVFFASGALLAILYFDNPWGGWWVDAGIGVFAGSALAVSQARSTGSRPDLRHLIAMALGLALALPFTRYLLLYWLPVPAALLLCLILSGSIVAIDYRSA